MPGTKSTARTYGGLSAELREAERRRRLLDAGFELFGTIGIAASSIGAVCEHAGLTKRYFYESFESLDALAVAVFDDVTDRIAGEVASVVAAGDGTDPRPAIDVYLGAVINDPRVARLLGPESRTAALAHRRTAFGERAASLWFAHTPAPDTALRRLRVHAFAGALSEVALAWVEGRIALSADAVIDELVALFHNIYLAP